MDLAAGLKGRRGKTKEEDEEEEEIKRSKIRDYTEAASAQFVTIGRVDLALCRVLNLR